ncbi:hypothetical protein SARC_13634 [Sphaeroforma arctica JP610]|uniref:Uncharacterized protein n=1 Tax=Sphaeroforma arctica JP610 TaxID=667725 RepID=A0A0L0FCK0_9EUKA|nr:hypothetical protein SARC_13634 [Sphaeroforma arctica JP610]KNC73808.1 hypothetical protein SARC_13634 [Sphaeroforma arctica JP610]|eukprot:XP_014147710.1 hypothetical protein SARC_13634 [Sphaeroforma arctica JP610]
MAEEWQRDTYIALFALNHKPILNRDETVRKSPSIVRDYPQSQRSSDCSDNMTCSDTFASKGRSVIRNAVVHKGSCHSMSTHKIGSTIEDRKGCSSSGTDTIVNSDEARSSSLSRSSNTTTHMTRKNVVSENSSSMGGSSTHPTDNAVVDSTGGNRITLYATKLRPESSSCLRGSNAKRRKRDTPVTLSSSIRTGLTCKDRDSTATSSDGSELPPIAGNVAVGVHTDTHRESECTAQVEDADEQSNHSRSTTPLTRGREVPIQHSGCGLVQAFQEVAVYPCDSSNVARALHNTVVNSGLGFSGGVGWGVWNSICGRSMGVGIGVSPTDTGMDSEARATKNINVPTEPATPSRLWG